MYLNSLKNGKIVILSETWRLVCICDHLLFDSFEFMNSSMIWIEFNGMTWEHWSSFSYFVQKYNIPSHLYHVVFTFMSHDKSPQKSTTLSPARLHPYLHENTAICLFFFFIVFLSFTLMPNKYIEEKINC